MVFLTFLYFTAYAERSNYYISRMSNRNGKNSKSEMLFALNVIYGSERRHPVSIMF
jgi:hypothetical protein